jgi:hypothetical protein
MSKDITGAGKWAFVFAERPVQQSIIGVRTANQWIVNVVAVAAAIVVVVVLLLLLL